MTTTTTTKIRCTLTNEPNKTIYNNSTSTLTTKQHQQEEKDKGKARIITTWLEEEPGKKSSFYLDLSSTHADNDNGNDKDIDKEDAKHLNINEFNSISITKPSHVILECFPITNNNNKKDGAAHSSANAVQWLFGGMEIQSNARNIELYATTTDMNSEPSSSSSSSSNNNETKEDYWHTSRGTKLESDSSTIMTNHQTTTTATATTEWYRTVLLPPSSKPTMVTRIHLKLLSLRPSKCCTAKICVLKVKGRLSPPDTTSNIPSPLTSALTTKQDLPKKQQPTHLSTHPHPPPTTTNTLQEAELGKALSTMALVVQTTKSQIVSQMESLHVQTKEMMILHQRGTLERLDKMEMEMKKMDWKKNGDTVGDGHGNGDTLIRTVLDPCLPNDDDDDDGTNEGQSKKKEEKDEKINPGVPIDSRCQHCGNVGKGGGQWQQRDRGGVREKDEEFFNSASAPFISSSALESLLEEQRKSIVKELLDGQRCMIRDVVMEVLQSDGAKMVKENVPSKSLENDGNVVVDLNIGDYDDKEDDNKRTIEQMVQNDKIKENASKEMTNITPSLEMVDIDSAIIDTCPNIKSSPTINNNIAQIERNAIMTPRKSIKAIDIPNQDNSSNNNNNNNNALLPRNEDDRQQNGAISKTVESRGCDSDPLFTPPTSSPDTMSLQETLGQESSQMDEEVDINDATVHMGTRKNTNTSSTVTENTFPFMCNQDRKPLERKVSNGVHDDDGDGDDGDDDCVGLDNNPDSNSFSNDTTTRSSTHDEKVKERVANQESINTVSQTNDDSKESCIIKSDDVQSPLHDLGNATETETIARGTPSLEHMLDGIMDTVREQVRTLLQSTLDQHYLTRPNDSGMETRPIVVEDGDLLSLGVDEGDLLTFT